MRDLLGDRCQAAAVAADRNLEHLTAPGIGARDIRHRPHSPGLADVAHIWRGEKPLWSTSLVFVASLPHPRGGAGVRLHRGAWFARKCDTAVYGVIELLRRAFESNTPDNLPTFERLGFRLGHALEGLQHGSARLH
jgi:hypothetical protein